MNKDLKYIIDKKGNRKYINDDRFRPSPKNFHNIRYSGNIFALILDSSEELEWRKSERYNRLCKRLYEDGLKALENLRELDKELSEEELLKFAEHCYKQGYLSEEDFNYRKNNIKQYTQERREHKMRFDQCSLDYKLELYTYIFDNGFDHFMDITKKQGHVINGVQIIDYNLVYFHGFDIDEAFHVMN